MDLAIHTSEDSTYYFTTEIDPNLDLGQDIGPISHLLTQQCNPVTLPLQNADTNAKVVLLQLVPFVERPSTGSSLRYINVSVD